MKLKYILTLDNFSVSESVRDHSMRVLFYANSIHFKGHNHQKGEVFFCKAFPKCHQRSSAFKPAHLKHRCGHCSFSANQGGEQVYFLISDSSVVVGREEPAYKNLSCLEISACL